MMSTTDSSQHPGMQRWEGNVALITGAATGIGKATARRLLQHGMKIVGCGRREEALQKLEAEIGSLGELTTIPCDVTKEDDVISMFSHIKQKYGGLDVCINNAGLAKDSPILSGKTEEWQLTFDTNVIGLLRVTRESVAAMKVKGSTEGHIINICSTYGHVVPNSPVSHVYSASKFAVTAITAGTRHELLTEYPALKCRVSQISPAVVETPFAATIIGEEQAAALFNKFKALEADDVAETVLFQLALPPNAQVQDVIMRSIEQQT